METKDDKLEARVAKLEQCVVKTILNADRAAKEFEDIQAQRYGVMIVLLSVLIGGLVGVNIVYKL